MAIVESRFTAPSVPPTVRFPGIPVLASGSRAVVWAETHTSQAAFAGPELPASAMAEQYARACAGGQRNVWGDPLQYLHLDSEDCAASACEGFTLAGGRVTSFTGGQGLLRMHEVLHAMAGRRLPVVIHVATRALTKHAANLSCGHEDVMGVAACGWGILFARSVQQAADFALIARRAAEDSETPFLCAQDGYFTTHTLESVRFPEPDLMRAYLDSPALRVRSQFSPANPVMSAAIEDPAAYMQARAAQRYFAEAVRPSLDTALDEFHRLTGRRYHVLRPYRMEDAEYALAGMGSMMETAETAVDWLRDSGVRAGAVSILALRPFPSHDLRALLASCRAVAVIERADAPLEECGPLATEVKAALGDAEPGERLTDVYSGVAGLGGLDVRPGHFIAAVTHMRRAGWRSFVLGVHHPEAIEARCDPDARPAGAYSVRVEAAGGSGAGHAAEAAASVMCDLFRLSAQLRPAFAPEQQGVPARFWLTLAAEPVRTHVEPKTVECVVIRTPGAFAGGDPLEGLVDGGSLCVETELPVERVWSALPAVARRLIVERKLRVWRLAAEPGRFALLGALLRLTPFRERAGWSEARLIESLGWALNRWCEREREPDTAGAREALLRAYRDLAEVVPVAGAPADEETKAVEWPWRPAIQGDGEGLVAPDFAERIVASYTRGRQMELEADRFAARGLAPAATAGLRSFRHLAGELPQFIAERCQGCMECASLCPDSALLARVAEPAELERLVAQIERSELRAGLLAHFAQTEKYRGGLFGIFTDPDRCKGCGECVAVCGARAALRMASKTPSELLDYDVAMDLYHHLPETPPRFLSEKSLGELLLSTSAHLYTGGAATCAGCGESSAIRLVLAATGFVYGSLQMGVVAEAGCHAMGGWSYPFNPFLIPWSSSLRGSAAADAIGIRRRWNQQGETRRRLWVIGSDAMMSDSGLQALSQLLLSGLDIKVLVLDTQAALGRSERRVEPALLAMMYPQAFVAQSTTAHLNHFLRAVMAANEYAGPALVACYTPCRLEHGIASNAAPEHARLAVDARAFPLVIYDPRRGERMKDRLSLEGNPARDRDWSKPVSFVSFARDEARFAGHFDADDRPDDFLLALEQERLENWRRLQELAGLR